MTYNKPTINGVIKTSKVIIELVIIFAACLMAWVTLRERVKTNCENIKTNQDEIKQIRDKTREDIASIQSDIRVMSVEQRTIKNGIEEIKGKLNK